VTSYVRGPFRYPWEHQSHASVATIVALGLVMTGRFPAGGVGRAVIAIGFSLLAATKFLTVSHRFYPCVTIKSPHSWRSNLPTGGWSGASPLEGRPGHLGTAAW
jgi:hypothetical protein